jgi:hypothetical protein
MTTNDIIEHAATHDLLSERKDSRLISHTASHIGHKQSPAGTPLHPESGIMQLPHIDIE